MLVGVKRHQKKVLDWQLLAILDLGSNTARLIIMRAIAGYAYRLEDEIREVVRLREGMTEQGLRDDAVERALFTLRLFKRFCDNLQVDQVIAMATSAVRDAANGQAFVDRVRTEIGWELRILRGEQEAYYDCIGALNEAPMSEGYVMDIGGGSVQLSEVWNRRYERGDALPLGALALTEQFITTDPIADAEFDALRAEIRRQLDRLNWARPREGWGLVGLGGTIRNLAKIESRRQNYPLSTLHGFELTRSSVDESIALFRRLPLAKRKDIPGLSSDRADIILAGALVVAEVIERLNLNALTISENGVREGIFFEQFWANQDYPVAEDVRRFSVLNLARVFDYHQVHAEHVQRLVRRLFIQLASLHHYGRAELELLEAAALLHDLGMIINYKDHDKQSQMLIVSSGLPGYTPREVALISLLARYHRKGEPTPDEFSPLMSASDPIRLKKLTALLRMAEYLERGRAGTVSDVEVQVSDDAITLDLIPEFNPAVEIWDAERNAVPLLEAAYERQVRIVCSYPPVE